MLATSREMRRFRMEYRDDAFRRHRIFDATRLIARIYGICRSRFFTQEWPPLDERDELKRQHFANAHFIILSATPILRAAKVNGGRALLPLLQARAARLSTPRWICRYFAYRAISTPKISDETNTSCVIRCGRRAAPL